MTFSKKKKIIVITGPTATGKSALGVELAKKFSGEIVSADSRQVYVGLDIGSAKITQDEMQGIPHHMMNIADPKEIFNVSDFQEMAREKMRSIFSRGNIPIIVGGSGMYISALIDDHKLPRVAPDLKLREELEKFSVQELFSKLEKGDPIRAKNIDKNNRARLIRALEISNSLGTIPSFEKNNSDYEILIVGLTLPKEELFSRIEKRIEVRIPALFDEIKKLLAQGVPTERLRAFGLEYKYALEFIEGKIDLENFKKTLATKTWQYVRRQMTWWKRDSRVVWMNPISDHQKIMGLVQDFLKK